jgi:hypothetical protein
MWFGIKGDHLTKLAGQGEATITGHRLSVCIPATLQYLWLRVE